MAIVAQGCELSNRAPTLLDAQALGNIANNQCKGFVTSAETSVKLEIEGFK